MRTIPMARAMKLLSIFLLAAASVYAQDGATHADWPSSGGTQLAWRYSSLDQINTTNVKNLAPAWIFQTGDYAENLQATPIVVDGVMYLITARDQVFALDAATGRIIWHYVYPPPRPGRPGSFSGLAQNRGVAVGDGKVFFGTNDAFLVALDQKTGRELWKVSVEDPMQCGCNIFAAPLVVKDKVIVGENGSDVAHHGHLSAFYMKTGRLAWRWDVIPGPGEKGHDTWKGDSWKFGGGAAWTTGSFDPQLNLVYWGTGNPSPDYYDAERVPGTSQGRDINLYTDCIVALDADTGELRWHYQELPGDIMDFDSAYEIVLIDREVQGRMRKILVHVNKSGITFVLDRVTGEFLGVFSTPEVQTWITGVTEGGEVVGRKYPEVGKTITLCPGTAGAKSWNQVAYSPRTGFVYMPINEICADITPNSQPPEEGGFAINAAVELKVPPGRTTYSHVDAWDPVTGKRLWSYPYKYLLLASVLATAGDLVFTGDPEGDFFALDARTGAKLWSFQTGAGNRGSAISYEVNGRQYIATPTGWQQSQVGAFASGLFPDQSWRQGSTLVVFALPEGSR
ncbi:MAG: PQQ-dependent dehydrogenase, methanol/ethanol family [Candidatus Acidiferrales bacterium]